MKSPLSKKIIFSFLTLSAFFVLAEIGARCWYYQTRTEYPLAWVHVYEHLLRLKAKQEYLAMGPWDKQKHYADFYNAPEMEESRKAHFRKYEAIFQELIARCKESDAVLIVLYIPSSETGRVASRAYFEKLVKKYRVPYLDVTGVLSRCSSSVTHLLPENGHLSRFGNQLTADQLALFLRPFLNHRSQIHYADRPKLLGDLRPNDSSIWRIEPDLPYRVVTNSQGLRRKGNVSFPTSRVKPRLLCLGDSFTFGPYMNNHDCYPQLLEGRLKNIDAINAGVAGYTICDELSYFEERGKYLEPDLVLLQVVDNDLYGLLPYMQKEFCRGGNRCIKKRPYHGFFLNL